MISPSELTVIRETPSSVEITRNSRGYGWSVKVYAEAGQEEAAMRRAIALERELEAIYDREIPS